MQIFQNTAFSINIPKNYPFRQGFRFYNELENGNNQAIDIGDAVFVLYVPDEDPLEFLLTKKANLEYVLNIATNFLSLSTGLYECAIFSINDYVPFAIGQSGVGTFIAPNQAIGINNASRNAIRINEVILENPAFADSETVGFSVVDEYDGTQTIQANANGAAIVLDTQLTGFNPDYDEPINAFDTVLSAFEKAQAQIDAGGSAAIVQANLDAHEANVSNPHATTKAQVGLGNADNTSDVNKPVSTAQAAAIAVVQSDIDTHEADLANPHQVTKTQVGLGNVDNTSDVNKPVSTAQQTALNLKEDKANKGAANGYAPLDGSAKVPIINLPELGTPANFVTFDTGGTPSDIVATTGDELVTILNAMPIGVKYVYVHKTGGDVNFSTSTAVNLKDVVILGDQQADAFTWQIIQLTGLPRSITRATLSISSADGFPYEIIGDASFPDIIDVFDGHLTGNNFPIAQVSSGKTLEINLYKASFLTGPEDGVLISINGGTVVVNIYTDTDANPISNDVFTGTTGFLVINDYRPNAVGAIQTANFTGTLTYNNFHDLHTIMQNQNEITQDYTLRLGYNGIMAGPVTVSPGVTITVPLGQRLVVV